MIYRLTWWFLQLVFRTLLPRRATGLEHVPRTGAFILASNHVSNLDPPAVSTVFWRPCTFMAKEELFEHRLFGAYLRALNAFPVKRGSADRAALKLAIDLLAQGHALVMFPEGTRSETGDLLEPELGIGMIAYRSGAPVIPTYIEGSDEAMPKGKGIRPARIGIHYGPPLRFTLPEGRKPGRQDYEHAAREIMAAIARLRDQARSAR